MCVRKGVYKGSWEQLPLPRRSGKSKEGNTWVCPFRKAFQAKCKMGSQKEAHNGRHTEHLKSWGTGSPQGVWVGNGKRGKVGNAEHTSVAFFKGAPKEEWKEMQEMQTHQKVLSHWTIDHIGRPLWGIKAMGWKH